MENKDKVKQDGGIFRRTASINSDEFTTSSNFNADLLFGNSKTVGSIPIDPENEPIELQNDAFLDEDHPEEFEDLSRFIVLLESEHADRRICRLDRYLEYRDHHPIFSGYVVYNEYENTTDIYGNNGHIVDVLQNPAFDSISWLTNNLNIYEDILTGEDLSYIVSKKLGHEIKEIVKDSATLRLTSNDIELLKTNPPLYKKLKIDKIQNVIKLTQIELEERFLFLSIYYPEQIPEFFTIVEKEPWSDLMRNYLSKLADLISAEMNEKDEIDDIEKLEEIAYKKSGYRETLAAVKEMAKEYEDYFKYCLVKDDKLLITKTKVDHLTELSNTLKNLHILKKCSLKTGKLDKVELNKEYVSNIIKDKPYLISDYSDISKFDSHTGYLYINIFKKVDINLYEFPNSISEELSTRMAILHEILSTENKKIRLSFNFIIVDKNDLCYVFEIKSSTIKKWKQKLYQFTDKAYWHIYNKRYDLPYDFVNEEVGI